MFNGGAWLRADGRPVDVHYRDLDEVEWHLAEAIEGRSGSNGCCSTWRASPPTPWSPNWPSTSCCTVGCPPPAATRTGSARRRTSAGWRTRGTPSATRGAYTGRGRLTETAGAIALAFAQGAHATLAARGEWITNEKAVLDRAGFRRADEVLGGLTADPPSLVAAADAASDLIGKTAG